jgi:hypothetical protein
MDEGVNAMQLPSRAFPRRGRTLLAVLTLTLLPLIAATVGLACDTPVYRYAMYRWFPAPYEVYYFYRGEIDAQGEKIKNAIDAAGERQEAPTNIVFLPVDLDKDKELTGVPPDVKEAWEKQEDPQLPQYLVSSPVGMHLHQGQLSAEQLPAMIDSPLRQQTGKLLESGAAGVYIFLKGEDATANAAAEKTLRSVVEDVGAGKVPLYSLPPAGFAPGDPQQEESDPTDAYKLQIGLVTLSRDSVEEKWLVDCLLALERDLRESKEPIVFMIYGRGRALFSCLGKGVHRDNLIQDIEFVTGACSCTVKEQNPGVDLLMCYNWDAAAEALSQEYGAEEGSAYEFGGDTLFPELVIPADGEMQESSEDTTAVAESTVEADDSAENGETGAQVETTAASADDQTDVTPVTDQQAGQDQQPVPAASIQQTSAQDDTQAPAASDTSSSREVATVTVDTSEGAETAEASESSLRSIVWVGAGLLGAFVVLLGATYVVLRPK